MSYITPLSQRKGLQLFGSPNELFLIAAIVVLSLVIGLNNSVFFSIKTKSEKKLQEHKNKLEKEVEERTSELKYANSQLEKDIQKQKVSVIMVEQHAKQALSFVDYALVLVLGKNAYEGKGQDLLKNEKELRDR